MKAGTPITSVLTALVVSFVQACSISQPAAPRTASGAPALLHSLTVTPVIKRPFDSGDSIKIRSVTGTASKFETGGTYRVIGVCRQQNLRHATLYLGNTAEAGSAAIVGADGSSLFRALSNGSTDFDITFTLLRPGRLHLTIYDL